MSEIASERHQYPNPQIVRSQWTDLCGEWQFEYDDDNSGLESGWPDSTGFSRKIIVPFPPESEASGINETGFHPVVWYRRTVTVAPPTNGHRILLNFGAVDYRAAVWVNGKLAARHEGGHTPFSADITTLLLASGEQTIVVRAEDPPTDVRIPRGKQDWLEKPHNIWYHRTTGIWQPVWLSEVPDTYVTDVHWTSDLPNSRVRCELRLNDLPKQAVSVRIQLRFKGEVLADITTSTTDSELAVEMAIPALEHGTYRDHLLWSPEAPNLVDATVTMGDDVIESYLGLRSAEVGAGFFLLNGLPYYLRLVLGQNYWPTSHLAAPSADALRHEVQLIKDLGFNGVRIHQKIEDPRFLYWCDQLGLVVWEEMPSAYAYSSSFAERLTREWMEAIRRDKSHPCIITWVPLNESWGVSQIAARPDQAHFASSLYHLTKALDATRPAISNDGWELMESDVWSVHDYAPDGEGLASRFQTPEAIDAMLAGMGPARRRIILGGRDRQDQPVMLTEFGGLSFVPKLGQAWHGYSTVADEAEYAERLADLFGAILASPHVAGFCYTQLTDTLQETNGLLTDKREPKLPIETIREMISQPAASVPNERIAIARRKARKASGQQS